ncbi:unnamed protein product [Schistosoma curassoni]|uniref:Neur_chan_LBD domain-containing protein n=1 Tax=Schistosoma curassoni TaxID=6186 RepID=A0A183KFQ4_9TREM|nr:unnamed protein product [Schistosoma curassoni]
MLQVTSSEQLLLTDMLSTMTRKWTDSLLRWNESEYGNIKTVRIFPSQIWTPDIKLYNFADERLREYRDARVVVSSNGETLWLPQALFKSTCEVEITYFPFDTQICMLEFGSLTYDRTQMDILWWIPDSPPIEEMPYLDFSDYVPSNEWRTDGEKEREVHHVNRTIQIRSVKKHRRRSQTVGNEVITREYPVLRYLIRLRRNPSFYVFMLVIPCVLLSSLTLVVFWLPPESPAKMMLGVFFCLNMIMITLSTFLATMVIHLYFRGDRKGAVPYFLRRAYQNRCKNEQNRYFGGGFFPQCSESVNQPACGDQYFENVTTNWSGSNEFQTLKEYSGKSCPHMMKTSIKLNHRIPEILQQIMHNDNDMNNYPFRMINYDESESFNSTTTLERDVRELKKYVKIVVNRQKETTHKSLIAMEWRTLAIVLDRLFFFIYITTILIAVVVSVPYNIELEIPEEFQDSEERVKN